MPAAQDISKIPSELWRYFAEFTTAAILISFDTEGNLRVYSYLPQTKDYFAITQALAEVTEQIANVVESIQHSSNPSEEE